MPTGRTSIGIPLLFPDIYDNPIQRTDFRNRIWTPAIESLNLEGLAFRDLRHCTAAQWIAEGVDARTVQHLLGHADPWLVLKFYAHSTDQALKTAAKRVEASYWPS